MSDTAERVLLEALDTVASPASLDLDALCRQHPKHASELRRTYRAMRRTEDVLAGLAEGTAERESIAWLAAELEGGRDSKSYVVLESVARGGMGELHAVWDRLLQRRLAMKVLAPDGSGTTESARLERFVEEARVTGRLQHPSIVSVHDIGRDAQGLPYFTMPLVEGQSLDEIIPLARARTDGWGLARAVGTLQRVCEAVAYAHGQGVVHRDLKPSNIMVGPFGETYVVDWGLATELEAVPDGTGVETSAADSTRRLAERGWTLEGEVLGTPAFMAPEQAEGRRAEIGPLVDVYAAGAILYQLLSGTRPYEVPGESSSAAEVLALVRRGPPASVTAIDRAAPAELVSICERAMARDPGGRYSSMMSMVHDLRAWVEGRVVRAHRTGVLVELLKWARRNRGVAVALATLAIGAAVVAVMQIVTARRERVLNDELRASVYAAEMSLAASAMQEGLTAEALARVEACEPRLRGWEWHRLRRMLDTSDVVRDPYRGLGCSASAVSADGRWAAVSGGGVSITVWSTPALELSRELADPGDLVDDLALSADGGQLVALVRDGRGFFEDLEAESPRYPLPSGERLEAVAFGAEDGDFLTGNAAGELDYWTGSPPRRIRSLAAHDGPVSSVELGRDGILVTAGSDGFVRGWNARAGTMLWESSANHARVRLSPDQRRLALYGSHAASTLVLGVPGSEVVHRFPLESSIFAWSHAGDVMALSAGRWSNVVDLLEVETGGTHARLIGHRARLTGAHFVGDLGWLMTTSSDGTVRSWDLSRSDRRRFVRVTEEMLRGVVFHPDGDRILACVLDGSIEVWNARSRQRIATIPGEDALASIALSTDGRRFAVGGWNGGITVRDGRTYELLARVSTAPMRIEWLEFDPSGEHLAAACSGGAVRVWNWSADSLVWEAEWHPPFATRLDYSPDGTVLATTGRDRTVKLVDPFSGELFHTFTGSEFYAGTVEFSSDGERLLACGASLSRGHGLQLIDPRTKTILWVRETDVGGGFFSVDGDRVFSRVLPAAGLGVFDAKTGRSILTLQERWPEKPTPSVGGHAFSPDGSLLVTAWMNGTLTFDDSAPMTR